jgi:hypothetical protein
MQRRPSLEDAQIFPSSFIHVFADIVEPSCLPDVLWASVAGCNACLNVAGTP